MKYETIKPMNSKEEVSRILKEANSTRKKIDVLLGAIEGIDDQEWLQSLCLKYIDVDDIRVAHAAIQGCGYIARIFRKLDTELIIEKLSAVVQKHPELSCVVNDALDDMEMFMKIKIDRSFINK
ncbi:MAG: hypothetical protein HQK52_23270 [Oligoflexia bacterium]|nr:hypothetical protein [Oligoflexia bacterium]